MPARKVDWSFSSSRTSRGERLGSPRSPVEGAGAPRSAESRTSSTSARAPRSYRRREQARTVASVDTRGTPDVVPRLRLSERVHGGGMRHDGIGARQTRRNPHVAGMRDQIRHNDQLAQDRNVDRLPVCEDSGLRRATPRNRSRREVNALPAPLVASLRPRQFGMRIRLQVQNESESESS